MVLGSNLWLFGVNGGVVHGRVSNLCLFGVITPLHYTTIDPKKAKIRTQDHNATIDPQKSTIRTHDHALHHHWPPKRQRFEPTTMHYATIPQK
jgi:hypothetical protein